MGRLPPLQGHASRERSRNAGRASLVSETDLPAARGLSATGTLCRGWDVGRLCYFRRRSRAKREEVRGRGEQSAGGVGCGSRPAGPCVCPGGGTAPWWAPAQLSTGNGRSLVPCCPVLGDHLSGGAQSMARPPGQLPMWRGLCAVFSPNQLQGRQGHRRVVMSQPRPRVREPA